MRLTLKPFIISIIAILSGAGSSVFAVGVNCNIVPLEGTGALSNIVTRPAWRIKPELPASGDFPWYPPAKSPQLYQFDCSDNPKGKPLSGVSPNIPVLQLNRK
ncbi:hypothetical protein ACJKIH_14805 [Brucella pseudogrignonensis]|uniref:hypothetical protein n=1 Tax=Brucella pseudogrignonensis TaxID=419475 RepID=UPI0038B57E86